ncbi:hypothetical protein BT96DRAFT_927479, partial [Gymnopus androsaceus JB14]
MPRRRKTQNSRKKKSSEKRSERPAYYQYQQDEQDELHDHLRNFLHEFARERYYAQNRSGTSSQSGTANSRSKFDEDPHTHKSICKAWEDYVDEELALYIGRREFVLFLATLFITSLIFGIFLVFITVGKLWNLIFRSSSHWYGVLFTFIYILCCMTTSYTLMHRSVNRQSYTVVTERGLPLLRGSHHIYFHTHPSKLAPSQMRNPFNGESHLLYLLRYGGLRFLNSCSFPLFYAPFLMFYVLASYYDTFPSQWDYGWCGFGAVLCGVMGDNQHGGGRHQEGSCRVPGEKVFRVLEWDRFDSAWLIL